MINDLNKVRVYTCQCGGHPVRPLHGDVKPSDCCGQSLDGTPFAIDDHRLFVREQLAKILAAGEDRHGD